MNCAVAVTLALVLAFTVTAIQAAAQVPVPPGIKKCVVFLKTPLKGGGVSAGTGFWVQIPRPENPAQSMQYFVTAKHVIMTQDQKQFSPQIVMRFNMLSGGYEEQSIPIIPSGDDKNVYFHDDPSVDLAVMQITPNIQTMDLTFVPVDMLLTKEDIGLLKIREGDEVFFTGLFAGYLNTKKNHPVVRFGRVAMMPDEKVTWVFGDTPLYLVEVTSTGGNSGSPAFFRLDPSRDTGNLVIGPSQLKLAGVVTGFFHDWTASFYWIYQ